MNNFPEKHLAKEIACRKTTLIVLFSDRGLNTFRSTVVLLSWLDVKNFFSQWKSNSFCFVLQHRFIVKKARLSKVRYQLEEEIYRHLSRDRLVKVHCFSWVKDNLRLYWLCRLNPGDLIERFFTEKQMIPPLDVDFGRDAVVSMDSMFEVNRQICFRINWTIDIIWRGIFSFPVRMNCFYGASIEREIFLINYCFLFFVWRRE